MLTRGVHTTEKKELETIQ